MNKENIKLENVLRWIEKVGRNEVTITKVKDYEKICPLLAYLNNDET